MATKLTTCFMHWNIIGLNSKPSNAVRFPLPRRRPLPASSRVGMRDSNSKFQNQPIKKVLNEQTSADGNLQPNEYDDSDKENSSTHTDAENANAGNLSSLAAADITPLTLNKDVAKLSEEPLGTQLQNLLDMMRYLEKVSDVHLLNKARDRALEDLQNILHEREVLRGGIEVLKKRLTETESQLKVVANKERVHVELLERECSLLESALTDLESKSFVSQEKLSEILSTLRLKIKDLRDEVENLHLFLDKAAEQADKPITVWQQNQNLRRQVENLTPDEELTDDMPQEFWSQLLLIIDGWSLEKKISIEDAKIMREKVWKRDRCIRDTYMTVKKQGEHEAISAFLASTATSSGLYVIHIAAEMAPVAKVGGLGDVVSGLCKALQKRGHLVEIILPKYDCMQYDRISNLRALDVDIQSFFDGKLSKNKIWVGTVEGLPVYFIEPLHQGGFFRRGQIYGEHDDFKRFSFFSRAALEFLHQSGKKPDIIHCHDWQTAFVAPLYWDVYSPKGLNSARICFTCHNFEYQGTAPASELASCGLDAHWLNNPNRLQDNKARDTVNLVKGGIVFSNIVTTVSPTYAQELQTMEEGQGLHSTLNSHSNKFFGILNGIDADAWNPNTDTSLKVQYNANDLQGKSENKEELRRKLGLSSSDARRPLVGCVTRLVPHKGLFLIRHAICRTLEMGGQFVLLGSSPIPEIQEEFENIADNFQNHDHVRLILKYHESLSRLIYAASDMFVIPSIFEPCGLTQMISMRYGAIPIARKTGGINDSVYHVDDETVPFELRSGFTFLKADEKGLDGAMKRAFKFYKQNPQSWTQLVQKVMNMDFSWNSSAAQYEELYCKAVARARRRNKFQQT